jgi:hypothetical protein
VDIPGLEVTALSVKVQRLSDQHLKFGGAQNHPHLGIQNGTKFAVEASKEPTIMRAHTIVWQRLLIHSLNNSQLKGY